MELNDRQYKRIALWLDGEGPRMRRGASGSPEPLELTPAELAVAQQLLRDGAELAGALEVAPPPEAVQAALDRIESRLNRRGARVLRFAAPALAAAAAVLLAFIVLRPGIPQPGGRPVRPVLPADQLAQVYDQADGNGDLDMISSRLDQLAADIVVRVPASVLEAKIDDLQRSVDAFWLNDTEQWPDEVY